jgi:putative transcriptional regulator
LDDQYSMARLVRELRELTGLTQEKFAAKLGVTFPTINRWENNRAKPSPLALEKIESLLRSLGDSGEALITKSILTRTRRRLETAERVQPGR